MPDLATIRNVAGLVVFLGVAFGGLYVVRAGNVPAARRRRRISLFIMAVVFISFVPGLAQRELYPFTEWPLVATLYPDTARSGRLVVVDSAGREYDIDYRVWQPMSVDEFGGWLGEGLLEADSATQATAARYLLSLVERGAERARRGEPIGNFDRFLGPFTAPLFLLHPKLWDDPAAIPPPGLTGLRFYFESWDLEARARGEGEVRRRLLFEYSELPP